MELEVLEDIPFTSDRECHCGMSVAKGALRAVVTDSLDCWTIE